MPFLIFTDKTRTDLSVLESGKELVFGSSYECDIIGEGEGVYPKHSVFSFQSGQYFVRPFSSATSFFVGEDEVRDQTRLNHGDALHFGAEALTYLEKETDSEPSDVRIDNVKRKIHTLLLKRLNLKKLSSTSRSDDAIREKAKEMIFELTAELAPEFRDICSQEDVYREVVNEAIGLGVIEEFLNDNDITEIMVKNHRQIYLEKKGKILFSGKKFLSDDQLIGVIERIVAPLGRRIDESSPIVDARLKDGSRVNAVIPPIAIDGPALTIRKFSKKPFKIPDLIKFGSMSQEIATVIELAVKFRQNVIISGGTGSGKTTLLNVSSSFIPETERIVTIEDSAELQLPQDHVIRLEARPPNIEGKGRITIRDLVINSLRMRPDRIVVGECRGGEALDMLQAMNTGHDGSLTTVHANAPRECLSRLETLVLMAGMDLPARAIREQISMAVHVIVQQARLSDGTRKITHVTEVTGINDMTIGTEDIFIFKQTGMTEDGRILGYHTATGYVPEFVKELQERGIPIPMHIFNPKENK